MKESVIKGNSKPRHRSPWVVTTAIKTMSRGARS